MKISDFVTKKYKFYEIKIKINNIFYVKRVISTVISSACKK